MSEWKYRGIKRRDFRSGEVPIEDYDDELPRKKSSRKKRKSSACSKSKLKENCDYSVPIIKSQWFSKSTNMWIVYRVVTCSRCGKHGAWTYGRERRNPTANGSGV